MTAQSVNFRSRASWKACRNCPIVSTDSPLIALIVPFRKRDRQRAIDEAGDFGTQSLMVGEWRPWWNKKPNAGCRPSVGIVTVVDGPKLSRDISNWRMPSSLLIGEGGGTAGGEERVLTIGAS